MAGRDTHVCTCTCTCMYMAGRITGYDNSQGTENSHTKCTKDNHVGENLKATHNTGDNRYDNAKLDVHVQCSSNLFCIKVLIYELTVVEPRTQPCRLLLNQTHQQIVHPELATSARQLDQQSVKN